jgi:membrane protease YdiL (CAAX protease family)
MDAHDQAPSLSTPIGAPPKRPSKPDERPSWPASTGLFGLLLALFGTLVFGGIVASVYVLLGFNHPDQSSSYEFAAIAAQTVAFVGAALLVTGRIARPTAGQFGFRPFESSAFGWALLALVVYFALSAIYISIAHPPRDDLPQQLGADQSTALAIITGVFVIGIAPPVEEFFFRGFLYQSLRNRVGVWGGAAFSGLIFGAIHFKPDFLVPLAILGTVLALLFQKTNSLWPCILVHALNNTLAFAVTL